MLSQLNSIHLMYYILATTITGSIVTVLWNWIGNLLEKTGFIDIQYRLLKTVLIFWIIPFSFFLILFWNVFSVHLGGFVFADSPLIRLISRIFDLVWGIGVVISTIDYTYRMIEIQIYKKKSIPCEVEISDYFYQICRELNISEKKVQIGYNYLQRVPAITCTLNPMVILPVRKYTKEECRVIFLHELSHYKQGDVYIKNLFCIISIINWMNPLIWWLNRKILRMSEYACDYSVITYTKQMEKYFHVILQIADKQRAAMMTAQLMENSCDLKSRVLKMKTVTHYKIQSKKVASLLVGFLFFISTICIFAVTYGIAYAYVNLYNNTVVEQEESSRALEIYDIDELSDDVIEVQEWVIDRQEKVNFYKNTIQSGHSVISQPIFLEDETVIASGAAKGKFVIGIVSSDQSRRYGIIEKNDTCEFETKEPGTYQVYIQNLEQDDLEVEVAILFHPNEEE